ncbi:hypothetical protein IWQ62_003385 [Dispira parvispora]|uniref:glucan 1,4-alpha-glucosidase n=1 Tax=Dispira parvispora TaxID=1520584 RepID=A0A9W8E1P7_9FUNG|nr:hypothetical protein IWQ62_003385 [Dispira parvispora]
MALARIDMAVSPSPDAARGSMQASPDRKHPDYYYHWVRDAALTMDLVAKLYEEATDPQEREVWRTVLEDHTQFSLRLQEVPNPSNGLGEPKFYMNGSAFWDSWGRPQNDGPAIRAFATIHYGRHWVKQDGGSWDALYRSELPATSIVKRDLEYVAHHWQDSSFDIWEEVNGYHFFNYMVYRRAMLEGAQLARENNDPEAARYYEIQAHAIAEKLDDYWDARRNLVITTHGAENDGKGKTSNLDVQVLLASTHAAMDDGRYSPESERILATTVAIIHEFQSLYKLNQDTADLDLGPAIGRYPEDVYNGYGYEKGNPWVLATACVAEIHYRALVQWQKDGHFDVTEVNLPFFRYASPTWKELETRFNGPIALPWEINSNQTLFHDMLSEIKQAGDRFLKRIAHHTPKDLNLYEQWNRDTGKSQGASHLTWSYASFISAMGWRERALHAISLD